jgi:glycerol-1-phosphate dehydrogenase [NAD(P)+]
MGFDKWKQMVFPRRVLVGHRVLAQLGDLVADLKLEPRALIVADETTKRIAGDEAARLLTKAGHAAEFCLIKGATMDSVNAAKAAAKKAKARYFIGAGGGSVIDVAKLAAYELDLPYLSLPTSAAHDGIASANASIKETEGNVSKTAKAPDAILADTHLIAQAPYRMLASGCGDVLANLVAVKDWELAATLKGEEYSSFAAALSRTSAELVLEEQHAIRPGLEEAVWIVVKSLITSGVAMSVAGNSRPASGSEHLFSHMLDRLAPGTALHGEQCGVGTIMMMRLHRGDWHEIRDALKAVGAPTTAKQMGHQPATIVEALRTAHTIRPDRYTILGETGLTSEAAKSLARETGVL